jgi:hypothetical protein
MSLTLWLCECGQRRIVECDHVDTGIPACPKCRQPMHRESGEYDGWLAKGLEQLKSFPGGMGEP